MAIEIPDIDLTKVQWIAKERKPIVKPEKDPSVAITKTTIRICKALSNFSDETTVQIGLTDDLRYLVIKEYKGKSNRNTEKVSTTKQGENIIKSPFIIGSIQQRKPFEYEGRYAKFDAVYDAKKKTVFVDLDSPVKK